MYQFPVQGNLAKKCQSATQLLGEKKTTQLLNPRLANFVFTFGGYDGGKNELAIEVGINNEGDLDIFGTDDILNDWFFYPYAYFL